MLGFSLLLGFKFLRNVDGVSFDLFVVKDGVVFLDNGLVRKGMVWGIVFGLCLSVCYMAKRTGGVLSGRWEE